MSSKLNFHLLDCSVNLTEPDRSFKLFSKYSIPTSKFFDLFELRDAKNNLTFSLPRGKLFSSYCENLNIGKEDVVICYDQHGMKNASRGWFTFKLFGLENAFVLDGGLPEWLKEGGEVVKFVFKER